MANAPIFKEDIEELLNSISPGSARAKLGTIIVALQAKVEALETANADLVGRVEALEAAAA